MEFQVSQEDPIRAKEIHGGDRLFLRLMSGSLEVSVGDVTEAKPGGSVTAIEVFEDGDGYTEVGQSVRMHFDHRGNVNRITY